MGAEQISRQIRRGNNRIHSSRRRRHLWQTDGKELSWKPEILAITSLCLLVNFQTVLAIRESDIEKRDTKATKRLSQIHPSADYSY